MDFGQFITILFKGLSKELPGEEAQRLMSPHGRPILKELNSTSVDPRLGATLMLLYPKGGTVKSVLIKRASYNGVHSAQVSFPGGKMEEQDENLRQTALRETSEEVGCAIENIQVLGQLTQVYIPPSNFLVSPFVAFCDEEPSLVPNPREVDRIIEFDLPLILDANSIRERKIRFSNSMKIRAPYFAIENEVVWGATAVVLAEFKALVEREKIVFSDLFFPTD